MNAYLQMQGKREIPGDQGDDDKVPGVLHALSVADINSGGGGEFLAHGGHVDGSREVTDVQGKGIDALWRQVVLLFGPTPFHH